MSALPPTEPVRHSVVVPVAPERAFALYVERPGRRHPAEGQSGRPARIVYEPYAGGRWYEVGADGTEYEWGRVLTWDPPRRLVLAWMVGASTGVWAFDPDPWHASLAEITFEPVGGGTRVEVVHSGFERHGPGGGSIARGVRAGWAEDLADLGRAASGPDVRDLHRIDMDDVHSDDMKIDDIEESGMIENGFVNLYTADMEAALRFYADTLGFAETFRVPADRPDHVELTAGGVAIALSTVDAVRDHQGIEASPGAPAMCLVLWVRDLDAAYETVTSAGAEVVHGPQAGPNGNRNALVRDPSGHLVEFVAKA